MLYSVIIKLADSVQRKSSIWQMLQLSLYNLLRSDKI